LGRERSAVNATRRSTTGITTPRERATPPMIPPSLEKRSSEL
jgi:hypothetical protein